jgi:hypothetical protein
MLRVSVFADGPVTMRRAWFRAHFLNARLQTFAPRPFASLPVSVRRPVGDDLRQKKLDSTWRPSILMLTRVIFVVG